MNSSFPFTDFAVNMTNVIPSYLVPQEMTPGWTWAAFVPLLVAGTYVLDFGSKAYRDHRLRKFGSPPPVVPFKAPLGQYSKHYLSSQMPTPDMARRGCRHIFCVQTLKIHLL